MSLSGVDAFGFHTQYHIDGSLGNKADRDDALVQNISIIIGYFPLVGTIIGLIRLHLTYNSDFVEYAGPDFILSFRVRAFVEICSLGFLLLIPDLIITLGRSLIDVFHAVKA